MAHTESQTTLTHPEKGKPGTASRLPALFSDFDQVFDQLRGRDWMQPFHFGELLKNHVPMFTEGRLPKVDIIDRDKDILLRAELPGVDKKDLDITMTDNTVTIKASSQYEQTDEQSDYYRSEIAQGQFARTVGLPAEVDVDQVKTSFKDGVLELTAPKLERARRRAIKIK